MRRKRPLTSQSVSRKPLIRVHRASKFFRPDKPALFDITFNIYPGEFIYVAGASGAGKSTLLRLLNAAETPDTGTVLFSGHALSNLKRQAIAHLRRSMGVVLQDFLLVPDLSVAANIGLPLEVRGCTRAVIARRVDDVLERVGMSGRGNEIAGDLSGGEQQRVAVARALAPEPEIVLADEPTGNLDAYNADFVLDLLEQSRSDGATVVLATHDRMLMAARPHRTIALDKGRIVGMSSDGSRACEEKERQEVAGVAP